MAIVEILRPLTRRLRFGPLALVLFGIVAPSASAHDPNITFAVIKLQPDRSISGRFVVKDSDLERDSGVHVTFEGSIIDPERVTAAADRIVEYLAGKVTVANRGGAACRFLGGTAAADPIEAGESDAVNMTGRWDCLDVLGELIYDNTLLLDSEINARQILRIAGDPDRKTIILDAANTSASITGPPPSYLVVLYRYIYAGIEHIFIGFDHIAFLIALLLWARRTGALVKIVTAFTVAHSITLTLSVLDVFTIPNNVAEGLIAASIVYVAAENFFRREVEGRWKITFLLGLIHGFGFASVLKAFGLPDNALITALASFNIGVEIGQIIIVAICVPVLLAFDRAFSGDRRRRRRPAVVYAVSAVILLLGVYWLGQRTLLA